MSADDEAFAALLDPRGLLREDASLDVPTPSYIVFAQRPDARLELDALRAHAERWFGTTIGITVPKRYEHAWPTRDAARFVVAPSAVSGGVRLAVGRPVDPRDLDAADAADRNAGRNGMFDLARRCPTTWHIDRVAEDDKTALLLAAIFSTTYLGPIFDGERLFAVRTARAMLESGGRPYR